MQRRSHSADAAAAIGDAAARWRHSDYPPRVRTQARIVERTGYSAPVVEYALDRLFGSISADALLKTIASEVGERRFHSIGRVAIISSRTTVGVAVVPAAFALCAGCSVLVKDREDALVASFFETLATERDAFASTARATQWNGERDAHDLSAYEAVVAFGGDDALRAIVPKLASEARFIAYGPKASIGYVTRETLPDEETATAIATGAARDLVLYNSEGCLSLHALFVERGGRVTPADFTRILATAVQEALVEFPLGERDAEAVARAASARNLAIFRGGPVYSDADANFVIETGSAARAPAFTPRVLAVHEVNGPEELEAYVARHALPLEACAVAGDRADVCDAAVRAGANRIALFGEMQNPPLSYAHGGRPRFAEFVRFISHDAP